MLGGTTITAASALPAFCWRLHSVHHVAPCRQATGGVLTVWWCCCGGRGWWGGQVVARWLCYTGIWVPAQHTSNAGDAGYHVQVYLGCVTSEMPMCLA
jgi:hypothetical protein